MLIVFGIMLIDYRWTAWFFIAAARQREETMLERYMIDRLNVALSDDHNFVNPTAEAEGIRFFKAQFAENDTIDVRCALNGVPLRFPSTTTCDDINGCADVNHIDSLKKNIRNLSAVHGFQRNAASIDVFNCTITEDGVF